ncbi:TonB-dependent receptor [Portibacter lacus]|uniref:TonB-dependent receptor n=1 Tax=Portibacter lacus TaxID=1099794 RepID=A0AA37SSL2_9BACT|nr:carboxypeptidase-like regulatory domain-containing protein [Portibacter lacus]GLR17403.1 TonB-dependent receptor [Portibacter lacus]
MGKSTLYLLLILCAFQLSGQEIEVFGKVTDLEAGTPIDFVTVYLEGGSYATETDSEGLYRLKAPANTDIYIIFTRIGYSEAKVFVEKTKEGITRNINAQMAPKTSELGVTITESRIEDLGIIREEVEDLVYLPTASGNFESVLPSIALGVSSGTGGELSSQYNVRGGNYDENLVYVNDFEIYRPQLIRSSQQEGLSFPNIDLIRDLQFSSGGFQAKYGDKLSSVLDISYKRPEEFKATASGSLLGASAHIEGSKQIGKNKYNKFRYLVGARYKTTKYLLGSLDIEGEYLPNFTDFQTYLSYDINKSWQVGVLANYNKSVYNFTPESGQQGAGFVDFALQLLTFYEGQEKDGFTNGMTGVSLTYLPERERNPVYMKFLASSYTSQESETFDIIGEYFLQQIETNFGKDNAGEPIALLGTGAQHEFTRNLLFANVNNFQYKGGIELQSDNGSGSNHFLEWSAKYQSEYIFDKINEWERLDSAGYSIPYNGETIPLNFSYQTNNTLLSNRFTAYFQDAYSLYTGSAEWRFVAGARFSYWDLNKESFISPRFQVLYKPINNRNDLTFKLSGGVYNQSPFYREMRLEDGSLNTDLQSQKSLHLVGGLGYDFYWRSVSSKKFRLISEIYYKKMTDIVSYEIDNVRIRYSGENDANAYAAGIDVRVNGEFVPGAESWVNLSFLKTNEQLIGVEHLQRSIGDSIATPVDWVPRPTDQFMSLNMFFQDYLPMNKNFKMNLNLGISTGLPFGLKGNNKVYRNTYRYPLYQRVDIGFAYMLWDRANKEKRPNHPLRVFRKSWLSLDVLNMLQIRNIASYTWVKAINNRQFAIPNALTSRRVNLRFKVEF